VQQQAGRPSGGPAAPLGPLELALQMVQCFVLKQYLFAFGGYDLKIWCMVLGGG